MRQMTIRAEQWPLHEPFIISRLAPMHFGEVVTVAITENGVTGWGECEHTNLYETDYPAILPQLQAVQSQIEQGLSRQALQQLLPAGCARNAIDCALWDLAAKQQKHTVWQLSGQTSPLQPVTTVFTLSLQSPAAMALAAANNAGRPLLKLKLGMPDGDLDRVRAVRAAAPHCRLVVDANTGWQREQLLRYLPELKTLGVELIEQPFPPDQDHWLDGITRLIPIAADESCLTRASLPQLLGRYDYINIKLDKTGGLTEALALQAAAKEHGLGIMVGCNIGTSLAMAPALYLAQQATYVDLDGPLLLAKDREHGLHYTGSEMTPPTPALWG